MKIYVLGPITGNEDTDIHHLYCFHVTEELNEVRMRLRIVDIVFTEKLTDSNSQLFKRLANDVEEAVSKNNKAIHVT